MSHSTVLIIGPDPEKQLEPFDETLAVEPYREDEEVNIPRARAYIKERRQEHADWVAAGKPDLDAHPGKDNDLYWRQRGIEEIESGKSKLPAPDAPDLEIVRWYCGEEYDVDESGQWFRMSTYNPKSKWDWYSLGGRWAGFFLLKEGVTGYAAPNVDLNPFSPEIAAQEREHFAPVMDGRHTDQARKGDADWDGMATAAREKAGRAWDRYQAELAEAEKKWAQLPEEERAEEEAAGRSAGGFLAYMYDVEDGDTRESYVTRLGSPSTFAVLKDGEWYERGKMGWWGLVRDEKDRGEWDAQFAALIDDLPDDTLLSLYDVHI